MSRMSGNAADSLPSFPRWRAAEDFADPLDPNAGAVAYLFRCRHCDVHPAMWDAD